MTKIITHIRDIVEPFSAIIVDQWGVMHDGHRASANAMVALEEIHRLGKPIISLSNSSRPRDESKVMLDRLGFEQGRHYDHIITSGADMQDQLLEPRDEFYKALPSNPRLFVLATFDGDLSLLRNIPCSLTYELEDADAMIITGLAKGQGKGEKLRALEDTLARALRMDIPLICPNADMAVALPDGSLHPCAGVIAKYYEQEGGRVRLHGKPDPHIYYSCFTFAEGMKRASGENVLAIGDSLANDIQGAHNANCAASLFIASGIHRHDLGLQRNDDEINAKKLNELTERVNIVPTFAMNELLW